MKQNYKKMHPKFGLGLVLGSLNRLNAVRESGIFRGIRHRAYVQRSSRTDKHQGLTFLRTLACIVSYLHAFLYTLS